MSLKWVDVLEIAIQLAESKPDVDPRYVNFVDLHQWVLALEWLLYFFQFLPGKFANHW